MKKFYLVISLLVCVKVGSQNKKVLYGFDKIPQGLLVNPGAETNYKYHVGVPVLSGISTDVGVSGFRIADLFRDDNINFNDKLDGVLTQLENNDYVHINSQIEVINGGYQINRRDYLTAGFYVEFDVFSTLPKDLFVLIKEGNAGFINKSFDLSDAEFNADLLGVLHVGLTRKMSDKLIVGGRLKIYSGSVNATSTGNEGTFTTRQGANSIYEHVFSNLQYSGYSSGLYDADNEFDLDQRGGLFFGSNLGLGFDVGFTYRYNDQLEYSASLLDVGFISYSENTRNQFLSGSYTFTGLEFQYDGTNPDYWQNLNDELDASLPRSENKESYTVLRPIKLYAGAKYSFGKSRSEQFCSDISFNDYYDNAVGGQLYSVLTPAGPRFALTGFYERKFSKYLNTKVTYTVDDFSYSNFGLGVSTNFWKMNVYAIADNIFRLTDIANANNAAFQFGINFVIK
ncbi:DUF5723 family protein [Tenacibaculum agarivorans]|uniref:DUF5723 family protein n=1 Tax=Tenacibaculum agarivorans TaxID=1908389 RepID=UPI00094B828C|nr:DUF5723 family protein [Tenacibaculum agarivorans]